MEWNCNLDSHCSYRWSANGITQGVPLGHLVGRNFRIGQVLMRGVEICEPCNHLVAVTGKNQLLSALIHRGGLHAQILTDGEIHMNDLVQPEGDE